MCELHRILFGRKIFLEFRSNVPEEFIRLPKKLPSHVSEVDHEDSVLRSRNPEMF